MDEPTNLHDPEVTAYLAALPDEQTANDARTLIALMTRISGCAPRLWNVGTFGFDTYHYKYDSGREGDSFVLGFYPRKGKITIYLMDGTVRYADLLATVRKHTTTGYCIFVKRLSDIHLPVLQRILEQSNQHIKVLSQDRPIDRILWRE